MHHDPQLAGALARVGTAFTRCNACGRRVALPEPVCPAHGRVVRPAGADVDSTLLSVAELPRFPGYRTLGLIAQGGFGTVFAAEPEAGGAADRPRVAIKLARSDKEGAGIRLVHEIAVLSDVGPPHVPAVYGSGDLADGTPYVILELIESPTLADRLASAEPMPLQAAIGAALATLRTLEAVHARGWVHRDLKPENVFYDGARGAKIVDFGLVFAASAPPSVTVEGPLGTAEYMAPEQCERQGDIDVRADIYAMGVILYELIAGAPPFWGPPAAVQEAHLGRRPPRLSAVAEGVTIPAALEEVVHRCLAKDRQERFASAAALREALVRATVSLVDAPAPPSVRKPGSGEFPAVAGAERRTVSLLFFESEGDVVTVQRKLAALGGQVAYASGDRYVLVYGHDLADNPVRPALRAAHELLREGLAERVRLDVGPVRVQPRHDGTKRFLSPLFGHPERFPSAEDPPGVSVTASAAEVLSDCAGPPSVRSGHLAPRMPSSPSFSPIDLPELDTQTGPLIGRDALLDALVESARRTTTEQTTAMVSVIGEAGHGKSHLFGALSQRLRELGPSAEVLELRAGEPALGGVDQTVRDLLVRALDLPDEAPRDGGAALLYERLRRLGGVESAPAVAIALGWMAMNAPGPALESGLRTLEAAPGALRVALTTAMGEALRRRAAGRAMLILLDDAHHADEATLDALSFAALSEARVPVWVCAFGRPAFEAEHPSWGERAGRREVHYLGPLDPASAAALCRRLLLPVEDVPEAVVERLVERAEAVPLLLVELTRGLRREGLVRRGPAGGAYYLATDELDRLPELPLVEWLARVEIDAMPDALRAHARLLALLGDPVSIPDAAGVLLRLEEQGAGRDFPLDAKVGARRLVSMGLLCEKGGEVAFRHVLVREAIARGVPGPLRERIHQAAVAHYLGTAEGARGDGRLAALAFHAAEAGLAVVAEDAYLELAERMRARHAYVPAERCYSRALDLSPLTGTPRRLAAYRGRGLMRYRIGRYHDALADLAAARALAEREGAPAAVMEILLDEATALDWMGEYKSSEERVEQARALPAEARTKLLEARLLLGIGRSLHRFSAEEDAALVLPRAVARAAALGEEGYETLVIALLLLGFIYQGLGRLEDARAALDRGIRLCEEHADELHLAGGINNRALLHACLGDRAAMLADMERGLALARKLGQASLELISRYNLAEYLYLMDDLDAAEPHVRRAVEIDQRLHGDGRAVVSLLDARIRFYRGDEAAARAILAQVDARQAAAQALGRTDGLMVPSEEVLHDALDLATRDGDASAWDLVEERAARYSVGQERLEVLEARALAALRRGRFDEAAARFEKVVAAAARIPNAMGARLARRLEEARRLRGR